MDIWVTNQGSNSVTKFRVSDGVCWVHSRRGRSHWDCLRRRANIGVANTRGKTLSKLYVTGEWGSRQHPRVTDARA